ncbi:hypothetical protein [Clostridium sp.]|uniref:hypothetical protein n=1 Tax=Clostridium sp. TaxID=1506 RepID=UPI0039967CAF
MKKFYINLIIIFLAIILLVLTLHTVFLVFKLQKVKSIPKDSINVSPQIDEFIKPTFNKTITYLGTDSSTN